MQPFKKTQLQPPFGPSVATLDSPSVIHNTQPLRHVPRQLVQSGRGTAYLASGDVNGASADAEACWCLVLKICGHHVCQTYVEP